MPTADALHATAKSRMPGGNTRTTVFVPPHPPYADHASGWRLVDVDGAELIDLQNNYTALIHGHAHPGIQEAATKAMSEGASFGLPTAREIELAELLTARLGWTRRWRFANSGTEAVMLAIRIARAQTGRDGVLRFDRAYHGTSDSALMPGAKGLPSVLEPEIVSVPFGDEEATLKALDEHAGHLACVLVDPMPNRAGLRPATPEFMRMLRAETERRSIVLIHDEVLTFRIGYGGMRDVHGVEPDLITLGKIIGGGFPIGAVGGSAELLDLCDPTRPGSLSHGGTFSANPVTMAAGIAAMNAYGRDEVDRLNELGDGLRERLAGQGWEVTGRGSLMQLHLPDKQALWWAAYEKGLLLSTTCLIALSTPMDEELITTVGDRLEELRGTVSD